LIERLARTVEPVDAEDVETLVRGLARAPFSAKPGTVPRQWRRLIPGELIGGQADSLTWHLLKRMADQQWPLGTTREQYLADLRGAITAPSVRIALRETYGNFTLTIVAPTDEVIPPERRGAAAADNIVVHFDAGNGTISTGYMRSALRDADVDIRGFVRWLR
jgi:hypothetical protein